MAAVMSAPVAAAPSLRVAPRRSGASAPLSARRAVAPAPLAARAVRFASRVAAPQAASCAAAVGAINFGGKGSVGAARFTGGASSSGASGKILGLPRFVVFAGIGIGMPVLAAIATALNSAVSQATAAAAYKLPVAVTILALALYYSATNAVSVARYKYKVVAPATSGVSADFDRYLRVQGNFVEGLVIFLPTLWASALLVNATAAAVGGLVWCFGRFVYAKGYYAAANQRGKGFAFVALAQAYLLVLAGIGAVRTFF